MKIYVNNILDKKFIKVDLFNYIALFLIIKKLNSNLQIYINFCALNNITEKTVIIKKHAS